VTTAAATVETITNRNGNAMIEIKTPMVSTAGSASILLNMGQYGEVYLCTAASGMPCSGEPRVFLFEAAALPRVTTAHPSKGTELGGTPMKIVIANFPRVNFRSSANELMSMVRFGDVPAESVRLVVSTQDSTEFEVVTPSYSVVGPITLKITHGNSVVNIPFEFEARLQPQVMSIFPNVGATGGTSFKVSIKSLLICLDNPAVSQCVNRDAVLVKLKSDSLHSCEVSDITILNDVTRFTFRTPDQSSSCPQGSCVFPVEVTTPIGNAALNVTLQAPQPLLSSVYPMIGTPGSNLTISMQNMPNTGAWTVTWAALGTGGFTGTTVVRSCGRLA
jgi:hypothetical protein